MIIDAKNIDFTALNEQIRDCSGDVVIEGCNGQRFIGSGIKDKKIEISGVPGNALGAYLNGAEIIVNGNAQDAVGDTMNEGSIIVKGNTGDAVGYAMRGGKIFVRGNAGYRAGIHMKEYKEKKPVMIVGGTVGSFLGEYQAGGIIAVLNIDTPDKKVVGNFPCTGMHGGKMFLRGNCEGVRFPSQVTARKAESDDLEQLRPYVAEFAEIFGCDADEIMNADFTVVVPDSKNPYRQMYVAN